MDETQGIEPVARPGSGSKPPRPARPWIELLLCVVGSLGSMFFSTLGIAVMVAGSWLLARKEEGRALWAVAGCLVPGIVLSFVSWMWCGSLILPCAFGALAIALVLPGRIGITSVCLTIVGLTAAFVASDASIILMQGGDLPTYISELLAELRDTLVGSLGGGSANVAVTAAVDQTLELFGKVWPLLYVSRAAVAVVVGLFALMIARRDAYRRVYEAFLRYDMPLWGVVALAGGLCCLAANALGAPDAAVFEAVGLNLLLCLRVLFFLQGLAVAMNLMGQRRWGSLARVLALAVLLMVEAGFYAVCVFGVLDVWANFRRLPRTKAGKSTASSGEAA